MRILNLITHLILLVTTPTLFAYPQNNSSQITYQYVNTQEWKQPTSYDGIVQLLSDIESDGLEDRYTVEQLAEISHYLVLLANQGLLPGDIDEEIAVYDDLIERLNGNTKTSIQELIARALMNKGLRLGELGRREEEVSNYKEVLDRFKNHKEGFIAEMVAISEKKVYTTDKSQNIKLS